MKKLILVCVLIFSIYMCGCSKEKYTYSDITENAGFEMRYVNGELLYIDYDLLFKVKLPNNSNFTYSYDYDMPGMLEGAPIGRTTLTIYYSEESEELKRNIIEIKSTQVGTREHEDFSETGSVTIPGDENREAHTYLIEEYDDGVRILSENMGELYCVKADLSKKAYHKLSETLEDIISSIDALEDDDVYFQEFARRRNL